MRGGTITVTAECSFFSMQHDKLTPRGAEKILTMIKRWHKYYCRNAVIRELYARDKHIRLSDLESRSHYSWIHSLVRAKMTDNPIIVTISQGGTNGNNN